MEQLKQWVREHFTFDGRYTFEENLNSNLDNNTIYYRDCKDFYEINPAKVIELAKQLIDSETLYNGEEIDIITTAARNGLAALVYNYMYSELEELYENEKEEEE